MTRIRRLNIYYLMMEKIQGFVQENKFRPGAPGAEIQETYENERTEAAQQVEALQITKRIASTGIFTCYLGAKSIDRPRRQDDAGPTTRIGTFTRRRSLTLSNDVIHDV